MSVVSQTRSDVYIFPEMFLTGYCADRVSMSEDVQYAVDKMRLWSMEKDIAIIVGAPSYGTDGAAESVLFIAANEMVRYDKPDHVLEGVRSGKPAVCSFKGMTFGLSVSSDLFFPEIYRSYALSCADVSICIASSGPASKKYFDRMLPARSLENLFYTVFVNSAGAGSSKLIGPLGDTLSEAGADEEVLCVYVDNAVVSNARKERKHLADGRPP
jgi:predicted amidohydrolase